MEELSVVLNCSLQKDFGFNEDLRYGSRQLSENFSIHRAAVFCIFSGILISLLVKRINLKHYSNTKLESEKNISRTMLLLLLLLLTPMIVVFLSASFLYKLLCSIVIRNRDKYFISFLDSFDVFWSLEDDATKSIINVLGIIESDSPLTLLEHIKDKLQSIVLNPDTEKIFYRRNEEYGFYYWRKCSYIDIDQYVKIVDVSNCVELNKSDLQEVMTEISYQSLPYNDEGLFQILITNQRVIIHDDNNKKDEYGIIFRIHHSVGDGVALIELLCQTLSDENKNSPALFCMPDTYRFRNSICPSDLMYMVRLIWEIPICFVDGILRKPDDSFLHGPNLVGKKVFKWMELDEDLLRMIKEIKDTAVQFNFSDILVTALSCGLRNSFVEKGVMVPENVAVILPIRLPKSNDSRMRLHNNFTVSILDVPIKGDAYDVKKKLNALRNSADPMTNHYFLKICSILPKDILYPMFNSSQATLVLSNMPGPKMLSVCGGVLNSLVFFIPNKGTTGLGITALCYGGVLRLAAMADSAVVSKSEDLAVILEGMVREIKRLHREHVNC